MLNKNTLVAIAAALSLACSTGAFAADSAGPSASPATTAPLAPGNAAGIHSAEDYTPSTPIIVGGAVVLGVGIALIAGGGGDHHTSSSSSTGAPGH